MSCLRRGHVTLFYFSITPYPSITVSSSCSDTQQYLPFSTLRIAPWTFSYNVQIFADQGAEGNFPVLAFLLIQFQYPDQWQGCCHGVLTGGFYVYNNIYLHNNIAWRISQDVDEYLLEFWFNSNGEGNDKCFQVFLRV